MFFNRVRFIGLFFRLKKKVLICIIKKMNILIAIILSMPTYLLFFIALICYSLNAQTTRFFVSAHQDDWQLFMNPNVYESIKSAEDTTVIIHTTAGEAGAGMGNDAYYKAREEGSLAAVRFLSNTYGSGKNLGAEMERSTEILNGHSVIRYVYRNVILYLLRLPDGSGQGHGYNLHDCKSLEKLFYEEIHQLKTIDGTTVYADKDDLIDTLKELVKKEQKENRIEFHLADTDRALNPNDHSDHQTSSLLFQEVAHDFGKNTLFLYVNYHTAKLPINCTKKNTVISAATWGVTTAEIADHRHYSTWDDIHNAWIGRQYYRTKIIP